MKKKIKHLNYAFVSIFFLFTSLYIFTFYHFYIKRFLGSQQASTNFNTGIILYVLVYLIAISFGIWIYQFIGRTNHQIRILNRKLSAYKKTLDLKNSEVLILMNKLKNAEQKIVESNSLKKHFLNNMSHEIRTPLNAIVGFSHLLKSDGLAAEKKSNFINIINESVQQLLFVVDDILVISALQTNQAKVNLLKVNIDELLHNLMSDFELKSEINHIPLKLNVKLDKKDFVCKTDKIKLNTILVKLLANAYKFTHEGYIELGCFRELDDIIFYVKDTGIGIKKSEQKIIFEQFQQANSLIHEKYGGTGLGLAIIKGYLDLLSGKVWVESEPGKGSAFYVSIPYIPCN